MNWAELELGILYGLIDVMRVVANTPTKQFVRRVDDSQVLLEVDQVEAQLKCPGAS